MSDDGFHVHGPHDHALEEATEAAAHDALSGRIAVTTAILATLAALCSYTSGNTLATAGLRKNDAAISKTEAANQWSYYQAKSTRESISEIAMLNATPQDRATLSADVARYRAEKVAIEKEARRLEADVAEREHQSEALMHEHHRWAQATTALQIAIAVAAIALITRRRWLQGLVYAFAAVGMALGALALLHV